ncbi:MAG: class I SAM-dependent methyltransferase [Deltaproteobacteria bacterium]|nr:class I SAM-dependent methyltransferase [Deltaproteobacteria bacterium]MBM4321937.1 class I SAM-dependent methyltransferase [Deltaproteobacteria bacterium]
MKNIAEYYRSQAGQERYLDALTKLASPSPNDVVLDVGTGSGTVWRALSNRVQKICAIDPNKIYIDENEEPAKNLVSNREVLHFNVEFMVLRAEDIGVTFSESYFDTAVCWGSVHHFQDYQKSLKGIQKVSKPGAKLIVFDAFFPEPVRDFWEFASTIHDPTTVRHHTYFEYMEMLRAIHFTPKIIIPFRHSNNLDNWLDTINRKDEIIIEEIKNLDPGKYDLWLEKAQKSGKGLRLSLREDILTLSDEQKAYMSIKNLGDDDWEFTYDTFVLMAEKGE